MQGSFRPSAAGPARQCQEHPPQPRPLGPALWREARRPRLVFHPGLSSSSVARGEVTWGVTSEDQQCPCKPQGSPPSRERVLSEWSHRSFFISTGHTVPPGHPGRFLAKPVCPLDLQSGAGPGSPGGAAGPSCTAPGQARRPGRLAGCLQAQTPPPRLRTHPENSWSGSPGSCSSCPSERAALATTMGPDPLPSFSLLSSEARRP